MTSQPAHYTLPTASDATETSRLTLQHRIWLMQRNGRLHNAPFDTHRPQRVLDLCCGTGIWAVAYAAAHPSSEVLGVDISPPCLSDTPVGPSPPPNLSFARGDVEGDWSFASPEQDQRQREGAFTFIYARALSNSIRGWDHVFAQAARHLVPGGWLQIDDLAHAFFAEDVAVTERESPMMAWMRRIFHASVRGSGLDVHAVYKHAGRIREAGFRFYRVELGRWYLGGGRRPTRKEDEIAEMWREDMVLLIPAVTEKAIENGVLGEVTGKEAAELGREAVRDLMENGVERGYYMEFSSHVAQREVEVRG